MRAEKDRQARLAKAMQLPKRETEPRFTGGTVAAGLDRQFYVIQDFDEYLECFTLLDGEPTEQQVNVAKNWRLRRSSFDGKTRAGITYTYIDQRTRMADNGVTQIFEVIISSFQAGDIIIARPFPGGGLTVEDDDENVLIWEDTNRDARDWAKRAS